MATRVEAPPPLTALPIDALREPLTAWLRATPARNLVLHAPPGTGKTTRVPRFLLDAGVAGEIVVLEPRRVAARLSAARVAEELGERVGGRVGYRIRFDDVGSAATRIRFVTEGILTRRLLGDPELAGTSVVILDEFHERHLATDVALGALRALQRSGRRPDLRIVVMSATLDAPALAGFLDAELLRAEGRMFEVALEHLERADGRHLDQVVLGGLKRLVDDGLDGDVLVFLPGMQAIRRAMTAAGPLAARENLLLLPLHGSLPAADQDRAIRKADRRKVVFATNVAETSLTIDGVVAVVDAGLARVATFSSWSGLPRLTVAKVAKAAAVQRAGRAGRTRPGRCLRLYTAGDFTARPAFETPELSRADLAPTVLELAALGFEDPAAFPWFEPPPRAALEAATNLLVRLGALAHGRPTEIGRRLLALPVHPRLGRLIVEADSMGYLESGCGAAALLAERDVRSRHAPGEGGHSSDVVAGLDALARAEGLDFDVQALRYEGIDAGAAREVARAKSHLVKLARRGKRGPALPTTDEDTAIRRAVLVAFPDRVARLRAPETATGRRGLEVVFAQGGSARVSPQSSVTAGDLVVAASAEEQHETGATDVVVGHLSQIDADWLLDLFTDAVRDVTDVEWAPNDEVRVVRKLLYEGLCLESSASPARRSEDPDVRARAARLVAERIASLGPAAALGDAFERLVARLGFAARQRGPRPASLPEALARDLLEALCAGATSLAEVRERQSAGGLERLAPGATAWLDATAPEQVPLPSGRRVRVNYPPDATPFVESRLQDFFGTRETPRIARGDVPLVVHLLAPNQRAVQVTTDLAGFWSKHYPAIAKELRRKYPRHSWPDDPLTATPPAPRPPRPPSKR